MAFSDQIQRIYDWISANINNLFTRNANGESSIYFKIKDRILERKHCPYCFNYVSKRIFKQEHRSQVNATVNHSRHNDTGVYLLPKARIYVCPSCNTELPIDFFNSKSSSIAVIGGQDAGKSSYITVFCELLLYHNTILNELGLFGSIINDNGLKQFISNKESLINQEIALSGTTKKQEPIVVQLQSKYHSRVLYITLIDNPGEDYQDLNTLIRQYPNVQMADGILFLLNPLDITGISNLIEEEKPGTIPTTLNRNQVENFNIIRDLYRLFVTTKRIKPNHKINIPTVFCLSRADLIEEVSNLYLPSDFDPSLVVKEDIIEEMHLVSEDLRAFLEEVDSRLLNMMEKSFRNFQLFPVSALGKTPTIHVKGRQKVSGGIDPKGVLQPFLWILIKTKFVQ